MFAIVTRISPKTIISKKALIRICIVNGMRKERGVIGKKIGRTFINTNAVNNPSGTYDIAVAKTFDNFCP